MRKHTLPKPLPYGLADGTGLGVISPLKGETNGYQEVRKHFTDKGWEDPDVVQEAYRKERDRIQGLMDRVGHPDQANPSDD